MKKMMIEIQLLARFFAILKFFIIIIQLDVHEKDFFSLFPIQFVEFMNKKLFCCGAVVVMIFR